MNEFELIDHYLNANLVRRAEVQLGIGDDCAIIAPLPNSDLLVSTDTLLTDVHFLSDWPPEDIAYKGVMVNLSDIAAMGGHPFAASLALTLPTFDVPWLQAFSTGLHDALQRYNTMLIGGDTTKGPLSLTFTIHGVVPTGRAVTRSHANPTDGIYVTGLLGLAAWTVDLFESISKRHECNTQDRQTYHGLKQADYLNQITLGPLALMKRALHCPTPRLDWSELLQTYASSAIDISDGLSLDLSHLSHQSGVGALIHADRIPVHPLITTDPLRAMNYALQGGDDYEICFTVPKAKEKDFLKAAQLAQKPCYYIGVMEEEKGLRIMSREGECEHFEPKGYQHFDR